MEANRIQNGIKVALVSALVLSIMATLYVNNVRIDLKEELNAERNQLQNTLEAKELLNKKLLSSYAELEDSKAEKDKLTQELALRENRILQLVNLEKQNAQLKKSGASKQKEIAGLQSEINRLKGELQTLEQIKGKEKSELRQRILELESDISTLKSKLEGTKSYAANYFRIEAFRGKKDKLTRKARRTQKILVSFNASEELINTSKNATLYLSISGPGTQKLTQKNAEIVAVQLGDKRVEVPVVAKTQLQKMKQGRQEIILTTQERLKPGIYQADVYTDTHHLGGAQIRLD